MDATIIEDAARDGFTAYFGKKRPGKTWPEDPDWTPEKQTWLIFAACILNGNITEPRKAYEWFIDIREGKGWTALASDRRDRWTQVYRAIAAHAVQLEGVAA